MKLTEAEALFAFTKLKLFCDSNSSQLLLLLLPKTELAMLP